LLEELLGFFQDIFPDKVFFRDNHTFDQNRFSVQKYGKIKMLGLPLIHYPFL
jgi:hypothetical protein